MSIVDKLNNFINSEIPKLGYIPDVIYCSTQQWLDLYNFYKPIEDLNSWVPLFKGYTILPSAFTSDFATTVPPTNWFRSYVTTLSGATSAYNPLHGYEFLFPKTAPCECGSEKIGSPRHSTWCPKC